MPLCHAGICNIGFTVTIKLIMETAKCSLKQHQKYRHIGHVWIRVSRCGQRTKLEETVTHKGIEYFGSEFHVWIRVSRCGHQCFFS